MAKVQFGAGVTAITGSIAGTTFQKNHSGFIMRSRGFSSKSLTQSQQQINRDHVHFLQLWQNLSPTNKDAWNLYASGHNKINKFGQSKKITGANFFESVNFQRELLSLPVHNSPPPHELPDAVPNFQINVTATTLEFERLESFDFVNNSLLVWVSPPTFRSTNSINQIRKFARIIIGAAPNPREITDEWQNATHLPWSPYTSFPRSNIFMCVQSVRNLSGITSAMLCRSTNILYGTGGIGSMIIETNFIVGWFLDSATKFNSGRATRDRHPTDNSIISITL